MLMSKDLRTFWFRHSSKQTEKQELLPELDLATFLIDRACKNSALANYFYWYVKICLILQRDAIVLKQWFSTKGSLSAQDIERIE